MNFSFNKYWVLIALGIIIFTFIFISFSEKLSSNIENKADKSVSIDKLKR